MTLGNSNIYFIEVLEGEKKVANTMHCSKNSGGAVLELV